MCLPGTGGSQRPRETDNCGVVELTCGGKVFFVLPQVTGA